MLYNNLLKTFPLIPWSGWQKIIGFQPEWIELGKFLRLWGFGRFSTMMIMVALNDYQLKGRAEKVYWPKLRSVFMQAKTPATPKDLRDILTPFYKSERLPKNKLQRLQTFLTSQFAEDLWRAAPKTAAEQFLSIWARLTQTMHRFKPIPVAKTIVFAMKCLGLTLIMKRNYSFDFNPIPIPVDSRVVKFTAKINPHITTENGVRIFWNKILRNLQKTEPRLTMIHLDSLIWQIAHMDEEELRGYFYGIGMSL